MTTSITVDRGRLSVTITATTVIPAPREQVWAVLTDLGSYPDWNPFVRSFTGTLTQGSRITVALQPGEDPPRTMRPTLIDVQPGRSFTWLGRVALPGVLDGRHTFTVDPHADGCLLTQHERLSGLLVPAFTRLLTQDTPRAFVALNDALAARVLHA